MNWTTPADLLAQVQRWWDRGELLRHFITGEPVFPLRLSLKKPASNEISDSFEAVRDWIAELRAMPHLRVEMREFSHRVIGANSMPQSVWIDTLEDALSLINKRRDAACFQSVVNHTREAQPKLIDWLAKRPLTAIELADAWDHLLDIVEWMQTHPRPAIYLRQVDIPGVDSKFIERHRGVLAELLDRALPSESIDAKCTGGAQFAARYGFREKTVRIRFRILDDCILHIPGACLPDVSLDAESFACLDIPDCRVFITENETNFLAFPQLEGSLIIFGAGYGWDALAKAQWLSRCTIHYWGDIDTHGFAILNQLRAHFDHVESFLMDRETLMQHQPFWGQEPDQVRHDLPRLTKTEDALFNDLRDNRIRNHLRMEQEMVSFGWVQAALKCCFGK